MVGTQVEEVLELVVVLVGVMVVEVAVGVEVVGVEGLEGLVVVVVAVAEAGVLTGTRTQPLPLRVVLPDVFLCFNLRLLAARL